MALSFRNKNEYSIVMDKYLWIVMVHFENYTKTKNLGVMKVPLASIYLFIFYLFIRTFTFQTAALAKSGAFIQQHI